MDQFDDGIFVVRLGFVASHVRWRMYAKHFIHSTELIGSRIVRRPAIFCRITSFSTTCRHSIEDGAYSKPETRTRLA